MAANQLAPTPVFKAFDNNGAPLYNGQLFTYAAGTTTPQTTYVDSTTSFPNTNPVVLNSRGEANVWLNPAQFYKFVLKDSTGAQIWSVDNIAGSSSPFSMPTASGTANVVVITNPLPISLSVGVPQWFVPVAANTAAATINVDSTGPKAVVYLTKALVGGELEIGVPALILYDGVQWNLINSAKGPATDYYIDIGTVNNLSVAVVNQAQPANTSGARIKVKIVNTNTSSPTIIWGGSGPFSILLLDRATTPAPGSLIAGGIADLIFDSALGAAILQNPARAAFSYTGTMTGITTTVTGTITGATAPDGITKTLSIPQGFTGTSNAATCTITGGPAVMQPTTTQAWSVPLTDAGVSASGNMFIAGASSVISFGNNVTLGSPGGFTASGAKTVPRLAASTSFTVVYVSTP